MKHSASLFLAVCLSFLGACSTSDVSIPVAASGDSDDRDVEMPDLPADYFGLQSKCIAEWSKLFAEWRNGGGGVKNSIAEMRMQIERDDQSGLARFVRATWANQRASDARPSSDLGNWPIALKDYRALSERIAFGPDVGISPECRTLDWFDASLWDEIASHGDGTLPVHRFVETPKDMDWTSPYAQQWMSYWLLIRLR